MATDIIELKHIDVHFKGKHREVKAVDDVSLNIQKGDIYGIVGYSGAGKSTLVRVVNLLQQPTAGQVTVSGELLFDNGHITLSRKQLRDKRRKIGMIFQHFNLLDEQTVLQNVAFALRHSGLKPKAITAKAQELLELVDLAEYAKRYPAQLSGGQKQRVAIARALANDPEILISDEATSALDPKNTQQILTLLQELNAKMDLTVVLITHEMNVVKSIANRIAVMENGKIIESGKVVDVFTNAQQALTQEFIDTDNQHGEAKLALDRYLAANPVTEHQKLFKFVYRNQTVMQPVIIEIYKQFGAEINTVYNSIDAYGTDLVVTAYVLIQFGQANEQAVLAALEQYHVAVTALKEGEL